MCDNTVNTEARSMRYMYKIHIFKLQSSMPNKAREMEADYLERCCKLQTWKIGI